MTEERLIKGSIEGNARVQKQLYERYSPAMYGICLRYAGDPDEAADILQEGFIKVFTRLEDYRYEGSFEGWIRRIIINTAINHLIKQKKHQGQEDIEEVYGETMPDPSALDRLQHRDLIRMVQQLPPGYRMVFNLYEIEGYSHKEIAEIMGISINTSKTQLLHARRYLQRKIMETEKTSLIR
jgi:RNA polymerase sigma factor (sigma-70 family)